MSVSIGINAVVRDATQLRKLFDHLRSAARTRGWTAPPFHEEYPKAVLVRGRDRVNLQKPTATGLLLLPHFACEPVPFVFLEPHGVLIDTFARDEGGDSPSLFAGALINTLFAGPATHAEVCDLLHELQAEHLPDLIVDDETGFFASRDRAALDAAFDVALDALRVQVNAADRDPADPWQVGPFIFEPATEESADEFDRVEAGHQDLIRELEVAFARSHLGVGALTDPAGEAVDDIDRALNIFVDDDEPNLEDGDLESFAHAAGARFGRVVVGTLGGHWEKDEDEGLILRNVGGTGLRVNPFDDVANRIAFGRPHSARKHYGCYETLVRLFAPRS